MAAPPVEIPSRLTVYEYAAVVTPSDTIGFGRVASAVYVGGAGTITLALQDGTTVQFTAVAGATLPVRCVRVNSTGTAATLIVALF